MSSYNDIPSLPFLAKAVHIALIVDGKTLEFYADLR
jgi:hypothetical protein